MLTRKPEQDLHLCTGIAVENRTQAHGQLQGLLVSNIMQYDIEIKAY